MFESITRMFGTDDSGTDGEQDGEMGGQAPAELGEQGGELGGLGDGQPVDDGPDAGELDARIDELSEDLDATESSVRELRSAQEEMGESVAEMEDTVRQLVGIYDRLAAEDNPFVDDPAEATGGGATVPDADGGRPTDTPPTNGDGEDGEADDGVVAFDDLEDQPVGDHQDHGDGERAGHDGENGHHDEPVDHTDPVAPADPPGNGPQTGTPEVAAMAQSGADGAVERSDTRSDGALLASVPDGYAGEVLLMEWLAALMERSGPAGALRAVDHYEAVGWVSPAVKHHLVDVIGGPGLDVFVDPTQPQEPTADEHALSSEYLRVLDHLTEV